MTAPRVIVVMPAYNAARTLERTYRDLPGEVVDRVIVVDDLSQDETVEVAQRLGLRCLVHSQNTGYGGNQKTCYLAALRAEADIVVMLHPDYQYDSRLVPDLIAPIQRGEADLVLGSRFLTPGGARAGGMPLYKWLANRFLTTCQNRVFGSRLSEFHTGFRAYSRRFLETVAFPLNSDDFLFDAEIIAQAYAAGFRIAEIAVPTRYFAEASSVNFRRSCQYGLGTLALLVRYWLHRRGLWRQAQFRRTGADVRLGLVRPIALDFDPGDSAG